MAHSMDATAYAMLTLDDYTTRGSMPAKDASIRVAVSPTRRRLSAQKPPQPIATDAATDAATAGPSGDQQGFSCRRWRRLTGKNVETEVLDAIDPVHLQQQMVKLAKDHHGWTPTFGQPISSLVASRPRSGHAPGSHLPWRDIEQFHPRIMKGLVGRVYSSSSSKRMYQRRKDRERSELRDHIYLPSVHKTLQAYGRKTSPMNQPTRPLHSGGPASPRPGPPRLLSAQLLALQERASTSTGDTSCNTSGNLTLWCPQPPQGINREPFRSLRRVGSRTPSSTDTWASDSSMSQMTGNCSSGMSLETHVLEAIELAEAKQLVHYAEEDLALLSSFDELPGEPLAAAISTPATNRSDLLVENEDVKDAAKDEPTATTDCTYRDAAISTAEYKRVRQASVRGLIQHTPRAAVTHPQDDDDVLGRPTRSSIVVTVHVHEQLEPTRTELEIRDDEVAEASTDGQCDDVDVKARAEPPAPADVVADVVDSGIDVQSPMPELHERLEQSLYDGGENEPRMEVDDEQNAPVLIDLDDGNDIAALTTSVDLNDAAVDAVTMVMNGNINAEEYDTVAAEDNADAPETTVGVENDDEEAGEREVAGKSPSLDNEIGPMFALEALSFDPTGDHDDSDDSDVEHAHATFSEADAILVAHDDNDDDDADYKHERRLDDDEENSGGPGLDWMIVPDSAEEEEHGDRRSEDEENEDHGDAVSAATIISAARDDRYQDKEDIVEGGLADGPGSAYMTAVSAAEALKKLSASFSPAMAAAIAKGVEDADNLEKADDSMSATESVGPAMLLEAHGEDHDEFAPQLAGPGVMIDNTDNDGHRTPSPPLPLGPDLFVAAPERSASSDSSVPEQPFELELADADSVTAQPYEADFEDDEDFYTFDDDDDDA